MQVNIAQDLQDLQTRAVASTERNLVVAPTERSAERRTPRGGNTLAIGEQSLDAYDAAIMDRSGGISFHVIVEPAGRLWHWIAWRPGENELDALRGTAPTVQAAMREAEQAAT